MDTRPLEDFALYQQSKGLSPRTIENRDYMLRALARAAQKELLTIDLADLRQQLGRGVSRGTMQTERDCYRAFYAFLHAEEYRTDDPSERLQKIRAPRGRPRPFTDAQIDAMLSSGAYGRTRAMILLAAKQGLRAGEVAAVHGLDFDLTSGTLHVVGKGGKEVFLPLHPEIRELAGTMPRADWWFPARRGEPGHIHSRSVSDLMTRAKRRAGIVNDRLTGHSLRHSYGTGLVRAGVDLRTVQELMRHESLATTQIYTLIDDEQLQRALRLLPSATHVTHSGRHAA